MLQLEDLSDNEVSQIVLNALTFAGKHPTTVTELMNSDRHSCFKPSGSDLFRPELWKPGHWNWFKTFVSRLA